MLSKLIYASQAKRPMSPEELTQLLTVARTNNEKHGLSGLLLYCNQSFLQVLEGETEALDALYQKIERDERHDRLRLLARVPIETRKFAGWSMGFEHVDEDLLAETLPGFKPATRYPLVSADLVRNGTVAETLLSLYERNSPED